MAGKTVKKGKKKGEAGEGRDLIMREISGILLLLTAALFAFGLSGAYQDAATLSMMRKGLLAVFGMTSVFVPAMMALTGVYVIWQKRELLGIIGKMFAAAMMMSALLNLAVGGPGLDAVVSNEIFRESAGGYLTAWATRWLAATLSVPGAFALVLAIGLIYGKLALGISYTEIGSKLAPYLAMAAEALKSTYEKASAAASERMSEMAENRAKAKEAENAKREQEIAAKAQKLKEAEARAMSAGEGFSDPLGDAPEVAEECEIESVAPEKKKKKGKKLLEHLVAVTDAKADPIEIETEVIPFAKAESGAQNVIVDNEFDFDEEPRVEILPSTGDDKKEEIMWTLPRPEDWLDQNLMPTQPVVDNSMRDKLESTLKSFQVPARISNVVRGPSFTRFEIELEPGTKVARIVSLEQDIALSLAADSKTIRIEAPIPGKSAIGIEIPNKERGMVPIRNIFMSPQFRATKVPLSFVLGEDIDGQPIFSSITKMPHMLVAGSTGSGKSVCLNGIITNIIAREFPSEVRFIMVDMKRVELTPYDGIPHLLSPVIQEAQAAANALKWVCSEMDKRYQLYSRVGVRNIEGYNNYVTDPSEKMHRIVFIIDELADLMMVSSSNMNIENYICRVAQLARATGIHLILATQRPDTKVITGTIKNNIPSRIAFAVASQIDSRTIIDQKGAESLLGRGDLLFQSFGANRLKRLQGAFVSDEEVVRLVDFWKAQGVTEYPLHFNDCESVIGMNGSDEFVTEDEKLYFQAVEIVVSTQQASISAIQRRLRIGYNRAARLVELMEERGVVGPHDGSRPREVLRNDLGGASSF